MSKSYWTDPRGLKWMSEKDYYGMYADEALPCFMCGKDTHRIDINFSGYFCNSHACNDKITEDLERLYKNERN